MSEKDAPPEDFEGANEDFAKMLEESLQGAPQSRPRAGETVQGRVLQIGEEWAFLDIGGKGEAIIDVAELRAEDGTVTVKPGDLLDGRIVRVRDDAVVVSRVLQKGRDGAREMLEQARELQLPVEGLVKSVVKGGLEVEVAGARAFCPASQIELRFVEDLSVFVGRRFEFRVTRVEEGGRNVLVSRRALLEEEQQKRAVATRAVLAVGATFTGRVTSLREFGAFVDIGGIDGLLHVSEISRGRVQRAADELQVGQEVTVQVIQISGERISLSMKSLLGDPFEGAAGRYAVGSKHKGVVSRIQPFGAFVELEPGVDGLLHVSQLGDPRIKDPRRVLQEGQAVDVTIVTFDPVQKRIGLALGDLPTAQEAAKPGDYVKGKIERVEPYGVFVRLPGPIVAGKSPRGLVPLEELAAQKADLKREFAVGTEIEVMVLEPDAEGRTRLSRKAALEREERAETAAFLADSAGGASRSSGSGFGTLAERFRQRPTKKK
jgi:small subunit ribosomal protein S1